MIKTDLRIAQLEAQDITRPGLQDIIFVQDLDNHIIIAVIPGLNSQKVGLSLFIRDGETQDYFVDRAFRTLKELYEGD
ncbi:hypothetical protein [Desulfonatronovibrio hydrogenovorans]|uniref:hypothetical protein n=1 Tax=Desulfonatronovibrio hydrogenovorans TaxID=53245 RepID=UPI0004901F2E|nr:hypothetical protein [Desulfonatronovibrio hydrogenovorans]